MATETTRDQRHTHEQTFSFLEPQMSQVTPKQPARTPKEGEFAF